MIEIIPAIIAKDFEDFCAKVQKVSPYVSWVHLDVADGVFAPNKTWGDPKEISRCPSAALRTSESSVSIEAHLMMENPESVLDAWLSSGVKRIIYHFESTEAHKQIIRSCRQYGISVFAALREETSPDLLHGIANDLNGVLLFSGNIGFYGSVFDGGVILPKIHRLHADFPNLIIEVDGGMNPQTAPLVAEAGASQIISGSYIFESENVGQAIEELREAAG